MTVRGITLLRMEPGQFQHSIAGWASFGQRMGGRNQGRKNKRKEGTNKVTDYRL